MNKLSMKKTPLKLQLFWILSFGGHHTKHSSKTFASPPSYVQRERSSVIGSFAAALQSPDRGPHETPGEEGTLSTLVTTLCLKKTIPSEADRINSMALYETQLRKPIEPTYYLALRP